MNAIKKIVMGLAVASAAAFTPTAAVANVSVTGADEILTVGEDTVYVFSTVGEDVGTVMVSDFATADILVVGGGGSGGGNAGSGGGAGGLVHEQNVALASGTYAIAVGAGGVGVEGKKQGNDGGNSSFGDLVALGGGGGGSATCSSDATGCGRSGGSGGGGASFNNKGWTAGAATQPTSASGGLGNVGGSTSSKYNTTGGGGAGGAGTASTSTAGAITGGAGYACDIVGTNAWYAGGGGGSGTGNFKWSRGANGGGNGGNSSKGGDATTPGSGGGGAYYNDNAPTTYLSGAGANGIVIVRVKAGDTPDAVVAEVLSVDVTYDGAGHEAELKVVFPENYEENWTWSDGTDGYANPEVFVEPGTYTNGVMVSADGLKPFVGTAEIKIRPIDLATQVTVETIPVCHPGAEYKPTPRVWVTDTGVELTTDDITYEYPDADYTSEGVHTVRIVGKRHAAGVAETRFFIFAGVFNVATNGDDVAGSGTAESPFRTIAKAVACATEAFKSGWDSAQPVRILLAAGTYEEHDLVLSNACQIVGQGATREEVIVDVKELGRGFRLLHRDASLVNLTICNAKATNVIGSRAGGGVHMTAGTVTNCVFRGCGAYNTNGYGGAAYVGGDNALVADCLFTGTAASGPHWGYGYVIWADRGRILRCEVRDALGSGVSQDMTAVHLYGPVVMENCLIAGVSTRDGQHKVGAALSIENGAKARVVNCSVIRNEGGACAGVRVADGASSAVNCVIYGNGGTVEKEWGNKNPTKFVNCAFGKDSNGASLAPADGPECIDTVTDDAFKGYTNGDYRLASDSVLKGAGTTWDAYHDTYCATSPTDLAGTLWGKTLDIGCYAVAKAAGLMLILR